MRSERFEIRERAKGSTVDGEYCLGVAFEDVDARACAAAGDLEPRNELNAALGGDWNTRIQLDERL